MGVYTGVRGRHYSICYTVTITPHCFHCTLLVKTVIASPESRGRDTYQPLNGRNANDFMAMLVKTDPPSFLWWQPHAYYSGRGSTHTLDSAARTHAETDSLMIPQTWWRQKIDSAVAFQIMLYKTIVSHRTQLSQANPTSHLFLSEN